VGKAKTKLNKRGAARETNRKLGKLESFITARGAPLVQRQYWSKAQRKNSETLKMRRRELGGDERHRSTRLG